MINEYIRLTVRSLYDAQNVRIQTGNRITASFRTKLGLDSQQPEESDENATKLLNDLRQEYKRITDGVARITRNFKPQSKIITDYSEIMLLSAYEKQLEIENIHAKLLEMAVEKEPIWTHFLAGIRGIGPGMAGVILSEVDIHKCNSISALWAYAGLDVVQVERNGELVSEGRSRRREHLVQRPYTSRDGTMKVRDSITFNPFLKTKMVGVLGDVFIKMGGPYADIYRNYKHRLEHHPKHAEKPKIHRHAMAKRYMIKQFLADTWTAWRKLEGLEVRSSYAEDKLGIHHHFKDAA